MDERRQEAVVRRLVIAIVASLGGATLLSPGALAAGSVTVQSASPALSSSAASGSTPASSNVEFDIGLNPPDLAGAEAFARAVSNPASASYRHFLTASEWERRFSPTAKEVKAVQAWLRQQGIAVEGVSPDRLTIEASASAATVEKAFATKLGQYKHAGRLLRLASKPLTVPASIAGMIAGVTGIDQNLATPDHVGASTKPAKKSGKEEIPQPEGFRNAPPCSSYYGQLADTVDPSFGGGFPEPLPYAVCGYVPAQLQGAYGLTPQIQSGIDGSGVTVAIVDAYASPTLYSDAHRYSELNQPTEPLAGGQFGELVSPKFNQTELCEASGWYGEQTLDVEAVHAMAPGANILYVGAKNCLNGLYKAVQEVVDHERASVITDSWGDNGGDLLDSAGTRRSFDHVLTMAIGIGIGVQFSAGDEGDEFANLGMTVADYPPSSPYQTAVGGTSLQVNAADERIGELGWSTSKSVLCTSTLVAAGYPGCKKGTIGKWLPKAPGAYDYGGGGGTSYEYPEPEYQEGVVPTALAERNSHLTGIPNRVEPDISMDADPTTGMLVGETQTFPDGVYYDQYRIGGTSLASPLFAGVMADADQAAGGPLGFVNPLLYKLDATAAPGAFYDVLPATAQANVRNDYLNGVSAEEGTITSVRTLDYQGKEEYCSGTGNCTKQKVAIETAPGFDSMTGIGTPGSGLIADLAAKP
jgi:subtilase family serine protease